jgi:hypothetical protein
MEGDDYIYDGDQLTYNNVFTSTESPSSSSPSFEDFFLNLTSTSIPPTLNDDDDDTSPSRDLCGEGLNSVGSAWGIVHGPLALLVCSLGVLANSLTLIVLTRKGMLSHTNLILAALAFADLLTEIEYIPFALAMKLPGTPTSTRKTYAWALFVLSHSNFSQVR